MITCNRNNGSLLMITLQSVIDYSWLLLLITNYDYLISEFMILLHKCRQCNFGNYVWMFWIPPKRQHRSKPLKRKVVTSLFNGKTNKCFYILYTFSLFSYSEDITLGGYYKLWFEDLQVWLKYIQYDMNYLFRRTHTHWTGRDH